MANQNTKQTRIAHGYKSKRGVAINSPAERKASGKAPWHPAKKGSQE